MFVVTNKIFFICLLYQIACSYLAISHQGSPDLWWSPDIILFRVTELELPLSLLGSLRFGIKSFQKWFYSFQRFSVFRIYLEIRKTWWVFYESSFLMNFLIKCINLIINPWWQMTALSEIWNSLMVFQVLFLPTKHSSFSHCIRIIQLTKMIIWTNFLQYFLLFKFIILRITYMKQEFFFVNTTGFGVNPSSEV